MAETFNTTEMSISRSYNEYSNDTYYLRLLMLQKYATRCKIVMGGATGLLFFSTSELIGDFLKIIAVILLFIIIGIGY